MNTPRTRLSPGSLWVTSQTPGLHTASSQGPGSGGPPNGAPRPPGEPSPGGPPPSTPMPGVEVNELNSDTMFDRLFGPLTPSGGPTSTRR